VRLSCLTKGFSVYPRLVAGLLFVFVFFLPLHFHPLVKQTELTQECSCVSALLTQSGPASAPAVLFHDLSSWLIVAFEPGTTLWLDFDFQAARAPPAKLS